MSEAHAATMSHQPPPSTLRHSLTIALIGFLTLVDLFATQAILPSLALRYGVSAAEIGLAANSGTIGMAIAGLVIGAFSHRLERRSGIWLSLALLAVPTTLLAWAPGLAAFALLRVAQGLCMASAFTLTLTYLAERCSHTGAATALAAYVTGGVASNLVGRLAAASIAGSAGVEANFLFFAALNLGGAALAHFALTHTPPMAPVAAGRSIVAAWRGHLANARLRRCFAIGFLVLFGFIGTFTYVNFVLAAAPFGLSAMALGLVYFVFLPSMATTPVAGRVTARFGAPLTAPASLAVAVAGLVMLLSSSLAVLLAGLALVGVGTFFAQAVATGYVGRAAQGDRAAASGLYLSSYYLGGLAGAAVIGQVFDRFGWPAAVVGIGLALTLAGVLGSGLAEPERG